MSQRNLLNSDNLDLVKRELWYKFIINVSLEQREGEGKAEAALEEFGYGPRSIDTIMTVVDNYRTTGRVI